ncbi:TRAP transporter large permease subunit [Pelagibius litoralis]|uniref:TRAP transporter large permease subunit n=1 Tax=Pelagibius litoralis TaxID=374515 RepID=A0A967C2P5_9PROT|nr:TRAP transporter large permease subunit [Pelagibius litoralis]NIA67005.1 TRAP transporter large permease subunit [Pelagibius litoralis]
MDPVLLGEILSLVMFATACAVLLLGFPVAFTLAGVALAFAFLGFGFGIFDMRLLGGLASRYFGVMVNELLVAVPLFVFMGVMLERSKIAEQLLETMGLMFGRLRGGLGLSVIFVGMLLAASTGIVGATVVTMGLLSLPSMLKAGYDPRIACGTICASGTLGQIIPPSIVLVLLGDILQGANTEAQLALGNFAPDPVSVVDLFAGAFLPGMMLVGLYMLWILFSAWRRPEACPPLTRAEGDDEDIGPRILRVLIPPASLIVLVLGSILLGVATPTEAAAMGCVGSLLLGGRAVVREKPWPVYIAAFCLIALVPLVTSFDLRMQRDVVPTGDLVAAIAAGACIFALSFGLVISIGRVHRSGILIDVMRTTVKISAMVFVILLGASVFSLVFRGLGGEEIVSDVLNAMPGGAFGAMLVVMALMFVMGFFLDFIEIVFVVVPIVGPILLTMGLNPVWLGVMIAVNLQTSFLTPPFGFALFYLRGVAPPSITTMDIYRGVLPFVVIQIFGLALIAAFPAMATWLPSVLFR